MRATVNRFTDIVNSNQLLYLGSINEKVTAKQASVILMPVLRRAANVVEHLSINVDTANNDSTFQLMK